MKDRKDKDDIPANISKELTITEYSGELSDNDYYEFSKMVEEEFSKMPDTKVSYAIPPLVLKGKERAFTLNNTPNTNELLSYLQMLITAHTNLLVLNVLFFYYYDSITNNEYGHLYDLENDYKLINYSPDSLSKILNRFNLTNTPHLALLNDIDTQKYIDVYQEAVSKFKITRLSHRSPALVTAICNALKVFFGFPLEKEKVANDSKRTQIEEKRAEQLAKIEAERLSLEKQRFKMEKQKHDLEMKERNWQLTERQIDYLIKNAEIIEQCPYLHRALTNDLFAKDVCIALSEALGRTLVPLAEKNEQYEVS